MAARSSQAGKKRPTAPKATPKVAPRPTVKLDGQRTGIYAGSFDPVTYGHLDVICRAAKIFDRMIVAIGVNQTKPAMFSVESRIEMIRELCRDQPNVEVSSFSGLAVAFAVECGGTALIRGLRTEMDFIYEMQMALMNRSLSGDLETIFIPTSQAYGHVSSTLVKEVATYGGDVSSLVPPLVARKIAEKTRKG